MIGFTDDHLICLGSCGSTNDEAFALLEHAPSGIVWTLDQRAGRGSRGRGWESPAGAHLAMTFAFEGDAVAPPSELCYPLLAGVVLIDALAEHTRPGQLHLKWPNDLLFQGRKLAGILCESRWVRDRVRIAIGIGVNLRKHARMDALPKGYAVLSELHSPPAPAALVDRLRDLFPPYASRMVNPGTLEKAWLARSALSPNTRLRVRADGQTTEGRFLGLSTVGALRLLDDEGRLVEIAQSCEDFQVLAQ